VTPLDTYYVQAPSRGVTDWNQSQGYREPDHGSFDESVGSSPSRVILFGDIPTVIPSTYMVAPETSTIAHVISSVAPVVETTLIASPTGLYGLVPYLGSDFDSPDEMSSLEHISLLPAISPFLCTDPSEAPDSSDGPPSQGPYVAIVARWRSRVTTHPSSSSEFPIASVTAPPDIRPIRQCRLALWHAYSALQYHHSSFPRSSSDSFTVHSLGLVRQIRLFGISTRDVSLDFVYPRGEHHDVVRHTGVGVLLHYFTVYPRTTSEGFNIHQRLLRGRSAEDDTESMRLTPAWRGWIDRIVGIETAQGRLEADQLIASGDRARMAEAIYSLRLENLKIRAMFVGIVMMLGRLRRLSHILGRRFGLSFHSLGASDQTYEQNLVLILVSRNEESDNQRVNASSRELISETMGDCVFTSATVRRNNQVKYATVTLLDCCPKPGGNSQIEDHGTDAHSVVMS
ncbi:hypothetical protein Tco_0904727, partial [Tanacetum coccineum]